MRKKKVDQRSMSSTGSPERNFNLELDITALRGKNKQLIQAIAKLQQEKAIQSTEITTLRQEFFDLNSKYANLKSILSTIEATTQVCLPKQVELTKAYTNIIHLCAVGATVNNPNRDLKTQTVKPQFVNGHVLQNPTITLSRFNDSGSHTPTRQSSEHDSSQNSGVPPRVSPFRASNNSNSSPTDVRPRTSTILSRRANGHENSSDDIVQAFQPVASRRDINLERLNLEIMNEEEDDALDTPEEDEGETSDQDYRSRLVTIQEEEEEAYNSTVRSLEKSLSSCSERVREIRIFLDPLPKDCMNLLADVEQTVNRTSSLIGEPSTSVLDPNNTLLNESSISEETMKFGGSARESQSFSFKRSPTKRKSDLFVEHSSSSSRLEMPDFENIRVVRGRYQNVEDVSSQKFKQDLSGTVSEDSSAISPVKLGRNSRGFSSSISAIHNLGTETPLNSSTNADLEISQAHVMNSLGLEPNNLRLTTSTPVAGTSRSSSRLKKLSVSMNSTKMKSPVDSKVTKRRGGSDDKKITQALIKRLSLEKKLSTGSPIKKIEQVLNTSPITRSSYIKKKGKPKTKNHRKSQKYEENVSTSNDESEVAPEPTRKEKQQTNHKNAKGKNKGKENRQTKTPVQQVVT